MCCLRPDEDEEHELGATMAATVLEDTTPPHTPPVRSASRPAGFAMSRTGSQHPSFGGLSYEEEEEESLHPDLDFDLKNQASEGYLEAHLVEELRDTIASAASEAQSTLQQHAFHVKAIYAEREKESLSLGDFYERVHSRNPEEVANSILGVMETLGNAKCCYPPTAP